MAPLKNQAQVVSMLSQVPLSETDWLLALAKRYGAPLVAPEIYSSAESTLNALKLSVQVMSIRFNNLLFPCYHIRQYEDRRGAALTLLSTQDFAQFFAIKNTTFNDQYHHLYQRLSSLD